MRLAITKTSLSARTGLTLVELLIVLVILIIVSTIAMQATSTLVDQARYDTTMRTMQNIQDAIVGPTNQRNADGTILVSGFVADLSQLPTTSSDLIQPPTQAPPFSLVPVNSTYQANTQVQIPYGWNGPYLQVPPATPQILDGWGNLIIFNNTNGVFTLTSLGADNLADSNGGSLNGYDKDILFTMPQYTGKLILQLLIQDNATTQPRNVNNSSDSKLQASLIAPAISSPNPTYPNPPIEATNPINTSSANGTPFFYTWPSAVAIGPRYLWASVSVQDPVAMTTTVKKSPMTRVMVRPTNQVISLILQ